MNYRFLLLKFFLSLSLGGKCLLGFAQNDSIQHLPVARAIQKEIESLNQTGSEAIARADGWLVGFNVLARALNLAREHQYREGEAQTLRLLAQLEANTGQRKEEALAYFMAELKLREELGNLAEVANTYMNLGNFFQNKLHDSEEAVGYFQQVLAIRQKNRQTLPEINEALLAIAQTYSAMDNYQQAIQYYQQVLKNLKSLQKSEVAAKLCLDIAQMYARAHNYAQAMQYAQEARTYHAYNANSKLEQEISLYIISLQNLQTAARMEDEQKSYRQWLGWVIGLVLALGVGMVWLKINRRK
ncbi:MAG: tetratricopeptide repeat protein [Microscillaceae bacterium]|nr:tetratricopeptide repeat protein [Microscillaceae bacterium]